jgi:hypothetical protein
MASKRSIIDMNPEFLGPDVPTAALIRQRPAPELVGGQAALADISGKKKI